jgi:hypothetical protein
MHENIAANNQTSNIDKILSNMQCYPSDEKNHHSFNCSPNEMLINDF